MHELVPSITQIQTTLGRLAREYPPDLIPIELMDIPRTAYHIALLLRYAPPDPLICDVGGGICMVSLGLASLGFRTMLIDDFQDVAHHAFAEDALRLHRRYGVQVISRDVIADQIDLQPGSIDVVASFHVIEHFHNSPKRLFHQLTAALRPGGIFLLCGPNRVNARKRMTVPFGGAPWTKFEDWYEPDVFRGHVREPDVHDLRSICNDLGLSVVEVAGRNWQGRKSKRLLTRLGATIGDRLLQQFPSLCSDIYFTARKPAP